PQPQTTTSPLLPPHPHPPPGAPAATPAPTHAAPPTPNPGITSYQWYDGDTPIIGQTSFQFTTPNMESSYGGYNVRAIVNGCESDPTYASIVVEPLTIVSVSSNIGCGVGDVRLTATSTAPGTTFLWYDSPTSTDPLNFKFDPEVEGYDIVISGSNNEYLTVRNVIPGDENSVEFWVDTNNVSCTNGRRAAEVAAFEIPDPPVISDPEPICGEGTFELIAQGAGVEWYTNQDLTGEPVVGNVLNTPLLTTSRTYYAISRRGACTSLVVSVDAQVNTIPDLPPGQPISEFCTGENVILSINDLQASYTIKWYDGTNLLINDPNLGFLPPGIYEYYFEVVSADGCISESRGNLTVRVNSSDDNNCMNWILTRQYDGYKNPYASNKTYFDSRGKQLQSQMKQLSTTNLIVSQMVYDIYDRPVLSGLSAPIDQSDFNYLPNFIQNGSGGRYDADDIGQPVGQMNRNTLGWYYGPNNDLEDHVPQTLYPYSQIEYYDDGTGDISRSAGVGEELRLGSGHEVYSRTFGVTTELNDYVEIRNQLFELAAPTTLTGEAIQTITIDQNGNKAVSFSDRSENVLLTARAVSAATDLAVKPAYTMEDKSYNFYDDAGRLKVSIAPNGVLAIEAAGGIATFTDLNDLPFTTYYTYNHQGWLLSTKETDAGITEYKYRKDGSIRFSQNAQQIINDNFSYTDYDNLSRPIESGEYIGSLGFGSGLNSRLEDRGFNTWPTSDKKDWVKTYYDLPDPDMGTETGLSLTQDFVMGAVSYTENEHIKTWYSYDEQGRITWMAQQPKALTRTFVVEYAYDFLGNVLSVGFTSYFGATPLDEFYHYYTYDADKRLSSVYTSLVGGLDLATINTNSDAELQAHYEYYLHGPLKRIELGGNLQGIDFVYNIQGWLKSINDPDDPTDEAGFSEDAFGMILNYYENNMSNLFGLSQNDLKPKPFQFHGLEENDLNKPSLAMVFDYLKPSEPLRDYSATNPIYFNQLKRWRNRMLTEEGGSSK
ncbi:MAG: hypothetical protein AAF693_21260, partial [Bacteroidota bacterium]